MTLIGCMLLKKKVSENVFVSQSHICFLDGNGASKQAIIESINGINTIIITIFYLGITQLPTSSHALHVI